MSELPPEEPSPQFTRAVSTESDIDIQAGQLALEHSGKRTAGRDRQVGTHGFQLAVKCIAVSWATEKR